MTKELFRGGKFLFRLCILGQSRNLEAGSDAESMKKWWLLACSSWIGQLSYSAQGHHPRGGTNPSKEGFPTSIIFKKMKPKANTARTLSQTFSGMTPVCAKWKQKQAAHRVPFYGTVWMVLSWFGICGWHSEAVFTIYSIVSPCRNLEDDPAGGFAGAAAANTDCSASSRVSSFFYLVC